MQKKSLFHHFSGFKKHYAFSKKLILALGDQYKFVYRYVLCLNIIKSINEPPTCAKNGGKKSKSDRASVAQGYFLTGADSKLKVNI